MQIYKNLKFLINSSHLRTIIKLENLNNTKSQTFLVLLAVQINL